jgi:hypothetical protein
MIQSEENILFNEGISLAALEGKGKEDEDEEDEEIINRVSLFISTKFQKMVQKYDTFLLFVSSNYLVNEIRTNGFKQVY